MTVPMSVSELIQSFVSRVEILERRVDVLTAALKERTRPTIGEEYEANRITPHTAPAEKMGRFDPTKGQVYFAHFHPSGRLKIGFSTNLGPRLKALESASGEAPKLIAAVEGNRALELRSNMALAAWRLRGEWFLYTPECAEFLGKYLLKIAPIREVAA